MYHDSSRLLPPTNFDAPAVGPAPLLAQVKRGARLHAIDAVRGLAIVLMVLDHTRDFFSGSSGPAPTDLARTNVALFFTRWLTHFCAPTFVFLAGTSAYLISKRSTLAELRRYLLSRGAWLILLEFTVINFVWNFNLSYRMGLVMQVIWAIGVSMCVLAPLVSLSRRALLVIGGTMVAGHNLLDGIRPEQLGSLAPLWRILHVQGPLPVGFVLYPVIPWIGVMILGYVTGELFEREPGSRRKALLALGITACASFVVLRLFNGYGDPKVWLPQPNAAFTLLSFLNVSKYPPSLDYLLVMLGLMLLALALFDALRPAQLLVSFGQVPLFAYVLHLALVHLLAGLTALALGHGTTVLTNLFVAAPKGWGVALWAVYLAWLSVLLLLYPACRWFGHYKRRQRSWWLSYC